MGETGEGGEGGAAVHNLFVGYTRQYTVFLSLFRTVHTAYSSQLYRLNPCKCVFHSCVDIIHVNMYFSQLCRQNP